MTVNAGAKSVRRQESIRGPPRPVAYGHGVDSGLSENADRLKAECAAEQATNQLSDSFSGKNEFFEGDAAAGHLALCFKKLCPKSKFSHSHPGFSRVSEAFQIRRTVLTVSDVFLSFQQEIVKTVIEVAPLSPTRLKPGENERSTFSDNAVSRSHANVVGILENRLIR